jgi:hypothetical protein
MLSDDVGLALLVGGAALVCSGLIFTLPKPRRRSRVQEDAEEIDRGLTQARKERGDLS